MTRTTLALGLLIGLAATLTAAQPRGTPLLNGTDLKGWTAVFDDPEARIGDVWTMKEGGVLACTGKPTGYLRTERDDYHDYKLTLEWRWPEGTEGGNNGVLVHSTTPRALGIWPRSVEVQLFKGNAGDFWVIGTDLKVPDLEKRRQGRRHLNLTDDSEKPIGEWNTMEVTCRGDTIRVLVNGQLVNEATDCSQTQGAICLQSEGAPIEFRNIVLSPLD